MVGMILLGTMTATVLMLLAIRELVAVQSGRRQIVQSVMGDELYRGLPPLERYDRIFRSTALGRRLERDLIFAGVNRRPLVVFAGGLGVAIFSATILWVLLAPLLGVLGLVAGVLAVRAYLNRGRTRRLEAFVAQMSELARVLANATNAGLSIHTAIGVAAEELEEPAREEMRRVASRISFGIGLDAALAEMSERLPSREVAVLTSTLVVSARSGGSLVSALRDIADTLEQRKETRREVRTTLAQALATGYLVIIMGFLILLVLNWIYPGSVRTMTTEPLGQVALAFAGILFTGGFVIIRRMTRVEA